MPISSPINYFGNRQLLINDIFELIGSEKTYECFYDFFSGSASLSLAAIERNIAKKYIINDAYAPLANLWRQIYNNHEGLISAYKNLLSEILTAQSQKSSEQYFNALQLKFNKFQDTSVLQAAYLAFILNHSVDGMPYVNNNQLSCLYSENALSLDPGASLFEANVRAVNQLFHKPNIIVEFTSYDFTYFMHKTSSNDFMMLDPPYPDLEDASENSSKHIYFRTENKDHLTDKLKQSICEFKLKKMDFIIFYALYKPRNMHVLMDGKGHLVRLSGTIDGPFGEYLENVYVSESLVNRKIPTIIDHYGAVKGLTAEAAISLLKEKIRIIKCDAYAAKNELTQLSGVLFESKDVKSEKIGQALAEDRNDGMVASLKKS